VTKKRELERTSNAKTRSGRRAQNQRRRLANRAVTLRNEKELVVLEVVRRKRASRTSEPRSPKDQSRAESEQREREREREEKREEKIRTI